MWRVGHSLIKARMRETGAPLAGEMSGHIFFADRFFGYDDAAYVGARLLELLSRAPAAPAAAATLSGWVDALPPSFTTPELRVACPDAHKAAVVARFSSSFAARYPVVAIDGARVRFPEGWGLLRASNTQPVLVLRFEARAEGLLAAYRAEVEGWLRAHAPEVDLDIDANH